MHDWYSDKKDVDKDKMMPWSIYCLKYGKGEEGQDIVRELIKKGEVFVKESGGMVYAGHRELESSWESGTITTATLAQAGSSICFTKVSVCLSVSVIYLSS